MMELGLKDPSIALMQLSIVEALLVVCPPSALITNCTLLPSLKAGLGVMFHFDFCL